MYCTTPDIDQSNKYLLLKLRMTLNITEEGMVKMYIHNSVMLLNM